MMVERGLYVDHTTIYRWVQRYAPLLEKKCRARLKYTNDFRRVDEAYIKVRGEWVYLYRAVDSDGNTVEFLLTPNRDGVSAKRFFRKALRLLATGMTNVQVAEHLFLSRRTVEAHVHLIFNKLDLVTRGEAIRFAVDHSIV